MKKIYIFLLLLITNAVSCSGMKMEQKSKNSSSDFTEIPLDDLKSYPTPLCQKALLPIEPDQKLIKTLYNEVVEVTQKFELNKYLNIITLMNNARNKNIDEDVMGKYSYQIWLSHDDLSSERSKRGPVLFFGYLKNYNKNANTTKEGLPSSDTLIKEVSYTTVNNQLAKDLGLLSSRNKTITHSMYDSGSIAHYYPAFHTLKSHVEFIPQNSTTTSFLRYIYSGEQIQKDDYTHLSYDNLKDILYTMASSLFSSDSAFHHLENIIEIIEAGKALSPQKKELDFGSDIIQSEQTITGKTLSLISIDYSSILRKRIGILCYGIKQYNDQRKLKKSPTWKQTVAWANYYHKTSSPYTQLCPHFILPHTFHEILFNRQIYALEEFNTLYSLTNKLKHTLNTDMQECIDQIYSSRK